MCATRAVLASVLSLALWLPSAASASPFLERHTASSSAGDHKSGADAETVASELQEDLAKISKEHASFFDDRWLKIGGTHFGRAQQAAKSLVSGGQPNSASISEFHTQLDEFLRGLKRLPEFAPGTSGWGDVRGLKKPSGAETKKVMEAVAKVKAKANQVPALQDVTQITFTDVTTLQEAVDYGMRVIDRIVVLLYERDLEQITGIGRRQTDDIVGKSIGELRDALAKLAET
jgi:hypothetical protein